MTQLDNNFVPDLRSSAYALICDHVALYALIERAGNQIFDGSSGHLD